MALAYQHDPLDDLRAYPSETWGEFLTPATIRVAHALRLLADSSGRLLGVSWSQIAARAHVDKRSVGRALAALEANMLAYVEESGRDRRAPSVIWTALPIDIESALAESAAALANPPRSKSRKRPGAKKGSRRGKK